MTAPASQRLTEPELAATLRKLRVHTHHLQKLTDFPKECVTMLSGSSCLVLLRQRPGRRGVVTYEVVGWR